MADTYADPSSTRRSRFGDQGPRDPYRINRRNKRLDTISSGESLSGSSPKRDLRTSSNPRGYTSPGLRDQHRHDTAITPASGHSIPSGASHDQSALANPTSQAWRNWHEVKIRVHNLFPPYLDSWELYRAFSDYGQISNISISEPAYGRPGPAQAHITFGAPPFTEFWKQRPFHLPKGRKGPKSSLHFQLLPPLYQSVGSPIDKGQKFDKITVIPAGYLTFGFMRSPNTMSRMCQVEGQLQNPSKHDHTILLQLDLSEGCKKIDIRFSAHPLDFPGQSFDGTHRHIRRYRLQAPLPLIDRVFKCFGTERKYLIISLKNPPKYFRQVSREKLRATHMRVTRANGKMVWKEWPGMWERQTDIDNATHNRSLEPVSLVKSDPLIDTGRWLTYRLDFACEDQEVERSIEQFCLALNHHNIPIESVPEFGLCPTPPSKVWKFLDPHKASHSSDLHQMQDGLVHLNFDVRYQLEACISQRRLNEFNMEKAFFQQLSTLHPATAINMLQNVAESKQTYHDPMAIFTIRELRSSRKQKAPHGCILMHAVTVTPTSIVVNTPTIEVSNRVIRDNSQHEDRFLRVKFEDEDYIGRLYAHSGKDNQEEVYNRIKRALHEGIDVAGRHYEYLAHGNSQFREHGAYFFARLPEKNADQIRVSLGQFEKINLVAKYAARIGQCFSTTRSIRQLPRTIKQTQIPDVIKDVPDTPAKKYNFTDGVGKVSPFVAQMIADEFRINCKPGDYPSVYQFRLGGHKGVLAVDPGLKGLTVHLRESQRKFDTKTEGLEIIRVSSFASSHLNQQIILVLSSLGIRDDVLVDKMVMELSNMDKAMTDKGTALKLLTRNVDFNQVTISMAEMILDGFMDTKEPFLMSLLQLWRAWCIKLLKEKAHISIEQGAFVLGCTDETKTLTMDGEDGLPEIFIQVYDSTSKAYAPIEGRCILARNPSLHPGDIRMVNAVNCDKLRHLRDVVVFPQDGTRDLANMCSGGDLDGDDYLVMWDETLFPPRDQWNIKPMDFTGPTPRVMIGEVTKEQLVENFVNYIKGDILGVIATRHRAWADYLTSFGGVKSVECTELAQLHSIAVDFPKSGIPATIPDSLSRLPKWPHWMSNHKAPSQVYHSKNVLGQLYDRVERKDFHPDYSTAFDRRILDAYELSPQVLQVAREMKQEYDADIRRIMAQHGVKTEFEVWTSFVMEHNREKREYVFAEEMGRLIGTLKMQYYDDMVEKAGVDRALARSGEGFAKVAPFVAAAYTVTKDEVEAARDGESGQSMPLLSFPWVFGRELGRIARRDRARASDLAAVPAPVRLPKGKQATGSSGQTAMDHVEIEPLPEAQLPSGSGVAGPGLGSPSSLYPSSWSPSPCPSVSLSHASQGEGLENGRLAGAEPLDEMYANGEGEVSLIECESMGEENDGTDDTGCDEEIAVEGSSGTSRWSSGLASPESSSSSVAGEVASLSIGEVGMGLKEEGSEDEMEGGIEDEMEGGIEDETEGGIEDETEGGIEDETEGGIEDEADGGEVDERENEGAVVSLEGVGSDGGVGLEEGVKSDLDKLEELLSM